MCRHMQRVLRIADCEKRRGPVRTCIYTTLKPVHNSFGEVNRTDTIHVTVSPCLQYTSDRGKENTAEILYFDLECELFVGYGG